VNDKVLIKTQPMSDAVKGVISKILQAFTGPFLVSKILDHSAYELNDKWGKICGEFNKKQLKPYEEEKGEQEG